jgi:hypothetical protein
MKRTFVLGLTVSLSLAAVSAFAKKRQGTIYNELCFTGTLTYNTHEMDPKVVGKVKGSFAMTDGDIQDPYLNINHIKIPLSYAALDLHPNPKGILKKWNWSTEFGISHENFIRVVNMATIKKSFKYRARHLIKNFDDMVKLNAARAVDPGILPGVSNTNMMLPGEVVNNGMSEIDQIIQENQVELPFYTFRGYNYSSRKNYETSQDFDASYDPIPEGEGASADAPSISGRKLTFKLYTHQGDNLDFNIKFCRGYKAH